ncbi:MAG: cation diffusion facilitator family transporter [Culicoidibacterales bacterium]
MKVIIHKKNLAQEHGGHGHHEHEHHHDHEKTHQGHHHGLGGHQHHDATASEKNLWIAFALNMSFAIIELIGGIWTGSTAILSDALHDFGDSVGLGLSALIQRFAKKQAKPKYNFGWKRLPVLGAALNIIILSISTIYIISEAIPRLLQPVPVLSEGMIWIALFGIIANGLAVFRMRGAKQILDRTVILHLLEDLFGWIAVLVVASVMNMTTWYWLDPLLSLIISGVMIKNIWSNAKIIIDIILGATLDESLKQELSEGILALTPQITRLSKFQLWSLDGDEQVACVEVLLQNEENHEGVVNQIRSYLALNAIVETTIECRFVENC